MPIAGGKRIQQNTIFWVHLSIKMKRMPPIREPTLPTRLKMTIQMNKMPASLMESLYCQMIVETPRITKAKIIATERVRGIAKRAPLFPISFHSAAIVARQGM